MMQTKFSKTLVVEFFKKYREGAFGSQRMGQAFYNFCDLHKCTQDKQELDKLYEMDTVEALNFIEQNMDFTQ